MHGARPSLECPECGKRCKTPCALSNHLRCHSQRQEITLRCKKRKNETTRATQDLVDMCGQESCVLSVIDHDDDSISRRTRRQVQHPASKVQSFATSPIDTSKSTSLFSDENKVPLSVWSLCQGAAWQTEKVSTKAFRRPGYSKVALWKSTGLMNLTAKVVKVSSDSFAC